VSRFRDPGEPVSAGRRDLGATERRALREALFAAALFAGVVLINGLLAILLIEFFQTMGWWGSSAAASEEAIRDLSGRFRTQPAAAIG
jgi:hypothetical protein